MVERIVEMTKTEQQFEEWEKMRLEEKKRQRDDRRLNLFWRRNKTFPCNVEARRIPQNQKKRRPSGKTSTTRRSVTVGERTRTSETFSST